MLKGVSCQHTYLGVYIYVHTYKYSYAIHIYTPSGQATSTFYNPSLNFWKYMLKLRIRTQCSDPIS